MLLWSAAAMADLSATADRRDIALGETLRLTLLGDAGEQPSEIDLTPLNRDWEILSRSSATNARFINGRNNVTRTLELELAPLREGTLAIPSLMTGGRRTTPISILVNPEPLIAPGDATVLFESSIDQPSLYVQAELMLTITLQQAINLESPEISALDIADAVVEPLERQSFQRRVGNRTWLVTELRYVIYPQKSGTLSIPAVEFTAREVQAGRTLLGSRLGRRIRLSSEPLAVTVKSVPAAFPGDVWLPARTLALTEDWSIDPETLSVGDSTTRTLTLIAEGLQGSQLPPLSSVQGALNIPELRFYPDQESIDQSEIARGLQGIRTQSEALVARADGNWTLPEIRIPWWNTQTDQLEYAVLEARDIAVQTADVLDDETASSTLSDATLPMATLPVWIGLVGVAGWLIAIGLAIALWRLRPKSMGTDTPQGGLAALRGGDKRLALVEVKRALSQQDASGVRTALQHWAARHHGRSFSSLSDIARASSPSLAVILSELDRSIYGATDAEWRQLGLIEALREEPAPERIGDAHDEAMALYPSR
tara:strand:- start:2637 stop:4259 length:1623 start_codon:yes stop_codon:yes gene_type:complete